MVRVKHREENSPSRRRGPGGRTEPGDIIDVSEETAQYLLSKPYFEAVSDDGLEHKAASEPVDADDEETTSTDEGFNADTWLDQEFSDRADRVRTGDVDEHLDDIDEVETSGTVRDAIGERRAQLAE